MGQDDVRAGEVEVRPTLLHLAGREAEQALELRPADVQVEPVGAGTGQPGRLVEAGTSLPTMVANGCIRSLPRKQK